MWILLWKVLWIVWWIILSILLWILLWISLRILLCILLRILLRIPRIGRILIAEASHGTIVIGLQGGTRRAFEGVVGGTFPAIICRWTAARVVGLSLSLMEGLLHGGREGAIVAKRYSWRIADSVGLITARRCGAVKRCGSVRHIGSRLELVSRVVKTLVLFVASNRNIRKAVVG